MQASGLHCSLGAMLQNVSLVSSGGTTPARTPTVIVAGRRPATTSSKELTCFPFRILAATSSWAPSLSCQAEARAAVAVAENHEGSASDSHPSSVALRESPHLETGMRGIADVIGNARSLDYSLERRLGEGEQQTGSGRESVLDWKTDERIKRSCEVGTSLRVAVLVSGGVDSSVALRLLCDAGHSCTAFYLKIWFQEDFENFWSSCPWEEDLSYAQAVCDEAGVELRVVHLTDAYWGKVVSESISEIKAGRTPNPDMLCNSRIKFGEFFEHIKYEDFDRIGSGHYAQVKRVVGSDGEHSAKLLLSADEAKDQTYFLSQLSQSQLARLIFPLGELTKVEVREVASAMGLSNKQRKDSQGICFLGKVKFSEFIASHLGEREGCLLEAETGELLGRHKGFWFYTIGQRQGIGLSNGPWFVVAKDVENNVIFVSRKYFTEKRRRSFRVGSFNWTSGSQPSNLENLSCKVRHGPKSYKCTMNFTGSTLPETTKESLEDNSLTADVSLAEDDQGLAPGQYAAFYQDAVCLGSGIIVEALEEEKALNVSVEALVAAELCGDPEFLMDHIRAKKKAGRNLSRDKNLESNPERIGSRDAKEDIRHSQSTDLLTEKHTKQRDAGVWPFSLLSRIFSWLQSQ